MIHQHANVIFNKANPWRAAKSMLRGATVSGLCGALLLACMGTAAAAPLPTTLITTDARDNIAINNAGTLAYTNSFGDVLTTTTGGTTTTIAQAQSFGTLLSAPRINDNGQVAFVLGGDPFSPGRGVALASGGSTTVLADTSTPSPSGGTFLSFPSGFSNIGLNANGDVAFPARAASGGTFLASGGSLSSAAVVGDSLGTYGTVSNFCGVAGIDNTGRVFSTVDTSMGAQAIVASSGSSDVVVVASGDPAPGGGTFGSLGCATALANTVVQTNGVVVFFANINTGSDPTSGIFAAANGQITPVAVAGQNLHGGLGKVQFFSPSSIAVNDNCQIAFRAGIKKGSQTLTGLFTFSANGFEAAVLEGDVAPDSGTFADVAGGDVSVAFANGNLAFRGTTSLGTQGTFLATPATIATCGEF
jgi:hypothetical protein